MSIVNPSHIQEHSPQPEPSGQVSEWKRQVLLTNALHGKSVEWPDFVKASRGEIAWKSSNLDALIRQHKFKAYCTMLHSEAERMARHTMRLLAEELQDNYACSPDQQKMCRDYLHDTASANCAVDWRMEFVLPMVDLQGQPELQHLKDAYLNWLDFRTETYEIDAQIDRQRERSGLYYPLRVADNARRLGELTQDMIQQQAAMQESELYRASSTPLQAAALDCLAEEKECLSQLFSGISIFLRRAVRELHFPSSSAMGR